MHVPMNCIRPSQTLSTGDLPGLGRDLTPAERELIRLLAEWAAEQLSLDEGAAVKSPPIDQERKTPNVFGGQGK